MGVIVCGPENGKDNGRGWLLNKISILMPMNTVVGASTGADKWERGGSWRDCWLGGVCRRCHSHAISKLSRNNCQYRWTPKA